MVYLETKECFLFSGGEVVRCEEADAQNNGCAEKMTGTIQGRKRLAAGGSRRTTGGKNQRTIKDHAGVAVVKYCSTYNELGATAGNSNFIKYWRSSHA